MNFYLIKDENGFKILNYNDEFIDMNNDGYIDSYNGQVFFSLHKARGKARELGCKIFMTNVYMEGILISEIDVNTGRIVKEGYNLFSMNEGNKNGN